MGNQVQRSMVEYNKPLRRKRLFQNVQLCHLLNISVRIKNSMK